MSTAFEMENLDYSEIRIINNRMKRSRQLKRRVSLFLLTFILLIAMFIIFKCASSNAKDTTTKTLYKYYKSIEINPNDTLSSIASEYMNEEKYTEAGYIKEVKFINSIEDERDLIAGRYLIIPYYDEYHG